MCIILKLTFHQNWVCFLCVYLSDVFFLFVCWNLHYYTFFCKLLLLTFMQFISGISHIKERNNRSRELIMSQQNNHLYYWSWCWEEKKKKQRALMEFFFDGAMCCWWWWWVLRVDKFRSSLASRERFHCVEAVINKKISLTSSMAWNGNLSLFRAARVCVCVLCTHWHVTLCHLPYSALPHYSDNKQFFNFMNIWLHVYEE